MAGFHPLLQLTMDRGAAQRPGGQTMSAPNTFARPSPQAAGGMKTAMDPMQLLAGLLGWGGGMAGHAGGPFGAMTPAMPPSPWTEAFGHDMPLMPDIANLDWNRLFSTLFGLRDFFQ